MVVVMCEWIFSFCNKLWICIFMVFFEMCNLNVICLLDIFCVIFCRIFNFCLVNLENGLICLFCEDKYCVIVLLNIFLFFEVRWIFFSNILGLLFLSR